jgi:hypothetical protein
MYFSHSFGLQAMPDVQIIARYLVPRLSMHAHGVKVRSVCILCSYHWYKNCQISIIIITCINAGKDAMDVAEIVSSCIM